MNIEHIACTGIVVAATGRIDQTRRVVTFRPFGNLTGLELPPCLIEGNPHHNTRMTAQLVDDTAPLTAESLLRSSGTDQLPVIEPAVGNPAGILVAAGHVLPDEHTQPVAMGIPAGRFDLDMLTDGIESKLFGFENIVSERLVRRGRIESVGPPALIEQSQLNVISVVQLHAHGIAYRAFHRYLTHGGITPHTVEHTATAQKGHFQIV